MEIHIWAEHFNTEYGVSDISLRAPVHWLNERKELKMTSHDILPTLRNVCAGRSGTHMLAAFSRYNPLHNNNIVHI